MASDSGYCTNVGKCELADKRSKVTITDRNSLICTACGKSLYVLPGQVATATPPKKIIVSALAVTAAIGLIIGALFYLRTPSPVPSPNPSPNPSQMAAPPSPAPASDVRSTTAADFGDDLDRIYQRKQLRIAVQGDAKPFFFTEGTSYGGFNIEFLQLLSKQEEFSGGNAIRVSVDRKTATYPEVPKTLTDRNRMGGYDIDIAIDGLTFLDGEEPGVVYSDPYIENFGYCLVTMPGKSVTNIEDLKGKRLGILKGDNDVMEFVKKRIPGVQIVQLPEDPINGERVWIKHFLSTGKVDAIVYDYPFAVAEVEGRGLVIPIAKLTGSELRYKIALRDGNPKLRAALNAGIERVKMTPQYGELLKKYFSSASAAKVQIKEGSRVYVVLPGDKLFAIAEKQLGSGDRYTEIEQLNNLPNPNFISIGQKLALPAK